MKPTLRSFARSLAFLTLLIGSLSAGDAVQVVATSPAANEQNLVPGQVLFTRTGSGAPLTVQYRISGSAHPTNPAGNDQDGSVAAINLVDGGDDYLTPFVDFQFSGGSPVPPQFIPKGTADGRGGRVTTISVTANGSNYTSAPSVTVSGSPYVVRVDITHGGRGYTSAPTVTFSGGGGLGAAGTATINVTTGQVNGVVITSAGSGYSSAPTVTFSGGGATTVATAVASLAQGSGATAVAILTGYVSGITVASGGAGYTSDPLVTISGGGGSGAMAVATASGGVVTSVVVTNPGSGYTSSPNVSFSGGGSPSQVPVATATIANSVGSVVVASTGQGYITAPTVSFSGGGGSGAAASATLSGSPVAEATRAGTGYGYQMPQVTVSGGGSGAVLRPVIVDGSIASLAIENAGSGYTSAPTVGIAAPAAGITATATVTIDSLGRVNGHSITNGGTGYGPTATANDPATGAETPASFSVILAGPDYVAPANSWIDPDTADLVGTITFAANQTAYVLDLTPRRNGVGGARTAVVSIDPDPLGQYIVNQQSSAPISIADADIEATLTVNRPTAYPTLPTIPTAAYPLEVQGRGEWQVHLNDDILFRSVAVQIAGDTSVGPQAVLDTEYWFGDNFMSIEETASQYATVVPLDPTAIPLPAAPGVGATTIPVSSLAIFRGNDIVVFESPTSIINGIYTVTGTAGATSTTNPTITITPAIKAIQTIYGTTRVRRLANRVQGSGQITETLYSSAPDLYFFAFPVITANSPRARSSINLTLLQNDDYRTLSPTSGTVTLADDAVTVGLRFNSNAGKPSTNGIIDVVLSNPFPKAVNVPFTVVSGGSAILGTDYTISGVDSTTRLGSIQIPANTTTAQIVVQPISNLDPAAKSLTLQLLASPDYLLAPTGTSGVNPSASLSIAPAPRTTNNVPVYLGITSGSVSEGNSGSLTVYLSDASGNALTGDTLATSAAVLISTSGTAVAGSNYLALGTSVQMNAGVSSVTIPIQTINNRSSIIDHTLTISLLPGAGYQLSTVATGTLTIQDTSPSISISAPTTAPVEGGSGVSFTITASRAVDRLTSVGFTIGGTATANADFTLSASGNGSVDYTALSGTTDIQIGSATTTVTLLASQDNVSDPGETVILTVQADSQALPNYKLANPLSTTTATTTIAEAPVASIATVSIAATSPTATQATTPIPGVFTLSADRTASTSNAPILVNLPVGGTAVPGISPTQPNAYTALPDAITLAELVTTADQAAGASFIRARVLGSGTASLPAGAVLRIGTGSTTVTVAQAVTVAADSIPIPLQATLTAAVASGTSVGVCTTAINVVPSSGTTSYDGQTVSIALAPTSGANWTATAANTAIITIRSGYPLMSIASGTAPVEGGIDGTFVVTSSQTVAAAVTVFYTVTGTATSGIDFTALSGNVVVPSGSAQATITVTALADSLTDPNETVILTLVPDTSATTAYHLAGSSTSASIAITEPPTTPIATVSAVATTPTAVLTPAIVPGVITFTADRTASTSNALVVATIQPGGTATPGTAYSALPASVSFPELVTTLGVSAGTGFLSAKVVGTTPVDLVAGDVLRVGTGSTLVTVGAATTVGTTEVAIPLNGTLAGAVTAGTSVGVCTARISVTPLSSSSSFNGQTVIATLLPPAGANWVTAASPNHRAVVTISTSATPVDTGKPAPVAGSTKSSGKCGLGGGLAMVGLAGMLLLAWRRRR